MGPASGGTIHVLKAPVYGNVVTIEAELAGQSDVHEVRTARPLPPLEYAAPPAPMPATYPDALIPPGVCPAADAPAVRLKRRDAALPPAPPEPCQPPPPPPPAPPPPRPPHSLLKGDPVATSAAVSGKRPALGFAPALEPQPASPALTALPPKPPVIPRMPLQLGFVSPSKVAPLLPTFAGSALVAPSQRAEPPGGPLSPPDPPAPATAIHEPSALNSAVAPPPVPAHWKLLG